MMQTQWQVIPAQSIPSWFLEMVKRYSLESEGNYAAQLLWQRGIQDPLQLPGFLDPDAYQPTSPFDFGQEMKWAVKRLKQAQETGEKVTIWGDFDADGVTATSVLWEGLGQFLPQHLQLTYYIPNRFTESHGLNITGIEQLATTGTSLIITCDTGSTNLAEIDYAKSLGIDIIITDHHTLPDERPPVIAIINPRYFADNHPLYHLSGVAVAYKLVEAMYEIFPTIPQQPLEQLLDLVAIGLIADLVALKGDCRYLAQKGIEQLQKQGQNPTRPGVAQLLKLCQRSGDRPTDISFGIGPRINAISRIHGDASFGVELLTSRDEKRCRELAEETELANSRRKSIQKKLTEDVKKKLAQINLSTTPVIVLENEQWQSGILGLVAGQIAQDYHRPTILLTTASEENVEANGIKFARGSARSTNNIDLYELVKSQHHLLHRFGGHPFAAGLSLSVENLELFKESINQQLRQQLIRENLNQVIIEADLKVTVAELGKSLFRELKLLEPYGMGNPIPKLLIENCYFTNVKNKNIEDFKKRKIQYIKTTFEIWDQSVTQGFPGVWWGHYRDDIPQDCLCDAIVELDFNAYTKSYEVRLTQICSRLANSPLAVSQNNPLVLLDWRNQNPPQTEDQSMLILEDCPLNWTDLQMAYQKAMKTGKNLALAYSFSPASPAEIMQQLIGVAKYLSRTQKIITKDQLRNHLHFSNDALLLGLNILRCWGFNYRITADMIQISYSDNLSSQRKSKVEQFQEMIAEEQFQRHYFTHVPLAEIHSKLQENSRRNLEFRI